MDSRLVLIFLCGILMIAVEIVCDRSPILDAMDQSYEEILTHQFDTLMALKIPPFVRTIDMAMQIEENNTESYRLTMKRMNFLMNKLQISIKLNVNRHKKDLKAATNLVWFVDGYESFLKIYEHAENHNRNSASSYFIELVHGPETNYFRTIERILTRMFEINVINVSIIVHVTHDDIRIYSYFPFTKEHCRKVVPVIIDRFDSSSQRKLIIYPKKVDDFHNCTLNILGKNAPPFMDFTDDNTRPPHSGFEVELLNIIAKELNFQYNLTQGLDNVGGVTSDGQTTGPYSMLQEDLADILMGFYFYSPTPVTYLSETRSYISTELVLIVAKSSNSLNDSEWILKPFSLGTWLTLLFISLFVFVIVLIVSPIGRRSQNVLIVLATALGLPPPVRLARKHHKFALIVWCISFLVLRSAYQGKIYDSYRTFSFLAPPASIDDVLAQNYLLYSPYLDNRTETQAIKALRMIEQNPDKKVAAVLNFARFLSYVNNQNSYNAFSVSPNIVNTQQICAYFRRHSYLSAPFNRIISSLESFGIIDKWLSVYHFNDKFSNRKPYYNGNPKPMSFGKFRWLFAVFVLLMFFSFVVFLSEVFSSPRLRH